MFAAPDDRICAGHAVETANAYAQRTGISVTITSHGRPVAVLSPAQQRPRKFGQLPALVVPDTFDDPLPDTEIAAWEGNS